MLLAFDLNVKYTSNLTQTSNVLQNNSLHFLDFNIHLVNNKLHLNFMINGLILNVMSIHLLILYLIYTSLFT